MMRRRVFQDRTSSYKIGHRVSCEKQQGASWPLQCKRAKRKRGRRKTKNIQIKIFRPEQSEELQTDGVGIRRTL